MPHRSGCRGKHCSRPPRRRPEIPLDAALPPLAKGCRRKPFPPARMPSRESSGDLTQSPRHSDSPVPQARMSRAKTNPPTRAESHIAVWFHASHRNSGRRGAMEPGRRWGWGLGGVVLAGLPALAPPAGAAEQVIFGPRQYTRTSGPPKELLETIALPPTLRAPFRLHIQSGNPDGSNRVSSATITLNGTQVATPETEVLLTSSDPNGRGEPPLGRAHQHPGPSPVRHHREPDGWDVRPRSERREPAHPALPVGWVPPRPARPGR